MGIRTRNPTSVMSFSIDLETLTYMRDYAMQHNMTISASVRYHVKMGKVYLQMLEEQVKEIQDANGVNDVET